VDADKLDRRTVSPLWETDEQYIDILLGPERTRECFLEGSNDNVQARSYRKNFFLLVSAWSLSVVCCLRTAQWTRASLL
jgi:hypothetical protein